MKDRIREVRSRSGCSMKSFGEKIGISAPSVARLESGENNPSEQTIRAICQEFHVSRVWLEDGTGPMILEADSDVELIDEWLDNCTDFQKACLLSIIKTPGGWEKLAEILGNLKDILDSKKPGD